jgi:hypothetical protein
MEVFLLPLGTDRYELYCEVPIDVPATERPTSLWGRMSDTFRRALAEGEAEHAGAPSPERGRLRRAITMKLASAVAEQRLLWQLRHQTHVHLLHADDMAGPAAFEIARRLLTADRDKHWRWLIIDAVLTVLSGLVAVVPGPNVLAYYFIFRTVGHYLSTRGAQHALTRVDWQMTPSPPLTDLRSAVAIRGEDRTRRVNDIARALGLERLARFIDRVCGPAA